MKKIIYKFLGIIFVVFGIIGAFLPIIPTTPFLLLASFFFVRSSQKLNHLLLTNPLLGEYLTNYFEHKNLPLSSKIKSISLLWIGLILTMIFASIPFFVYFILIIVGISVTLHISLLGRRKSTQERKAINLLNRTDKTDKKINEAN